MKPALSGVRVLDVSQFEAGGVCTLLLAWLGADVVKVEPPGGEQGRRAAGGGDRYAFLLMNANKRSVTLNLKSAEGRELMRRLLGRADVLVENLGPGVAERLGLGEEEVFRVNPRVIFARIKGFPRGTRYQDLPAFDPVGQATGGLASITGEADGPPLRAGANVADSGAGMYAALGVVAALLQRERSGKGQTVEVSLQGSVMMLCRGAWTWVNRGEVSPRVGNGMAMAAVAPAGAYRCWPGGPNDYVFVYTSRWSGSDQWERLCRVIGREEWIRDPGLSTPQRRYERRTEIDEAIGAWTAGRTKWQAMEELGSAGVPAGAVLTIAELAEDPELHRVGLVVEVDDPEGGTVRMPGMPVRMSASPVSYTSAPALGQHNQEVYGELGLGPEELESLRRRGVI
jgi:formyl-CoA transferase